MQSTPMWVSPNEMRRTFVISETEGDERPVQASASLSVAGERSLAILRDLFGDAFARGFGVRLWDGTHVPASGDERFTLVLAAPFTLRAALAPPFDLNPARAFLLGWLDVEGDLEASIDTLLTALQAFPRRRLPRLLSALLRLPKPPSAASQHVAALGGAQHSPERDALAIRHHYDRPAAFYRTFLDESLTYSCAYFDDGVTSLEQAQSAKLDHILRKLRLRPGEQLLDIGCGWGSLAIRAAERFDARVLGITLSREQHREASRRVREAGLDGRVRVELRDYRELDSAAFDKIVSVGMAEHVGLERLDEYFSVVFRALRPGGLFLNHAIGQLDRGRSYRVSGFIARYIFPDGELVSLSAALACAERAGFEVRDVENLREHYARTLRAWLENLQRNEAAAVAASDVETWRAWRAYLAGSAQGFARARMSVYQTLLAKVERGGAAGLPPTRRDLYEG